jgi:RimJ/RimL family protein N-acetyltransferase
LDRPLRTVAARRWPGHEIGCAITHDCSGRGYATEGAIAATNWAFEHLGWTEVIHAIAPENVPSQHVDERLGSRNRGPGRLPAPVDNVAIDLWGQTLDEWRQRR